MRLAALLYTGMLLIASNAIAEDIDIDALSDMRSGDMRKLRFHSEAQPGSDVAFLAPDGSSLTLAAFEGKYIVLNFWATWCAPCRKEMPELSALQTEMGSDEFSVVIIATGPNPAHSIARFMAEIEVDNLPIYTDLSAELSRDFGVLGLPNTLILNPQGEEIGRMQGAADWSSESAQLIISTLLASED